MVKRDGSNRRPSSKRDCRQVEERTTNICSTHGMGRESVVVESDTWAVVSWLLLNHIIEADDGVMRSNCKQSIYVLCRLKRLLSCMRGSFGS